MSLGEAALYTTTPAWHGLGNVVPGGTSDVDEVLKLGGIDFQVELRAVRYSFEGGLREMPGYYVTLRDDTGAALGTRTRGGLCGTPRRRPIGSPMPAAPWACR